MTSRCEKTRSKTVVSLAAALWLTAWSFGGASLAAAQTSADDDDARIRVNCDAGQTIGRALQRARPGTTIQVRGTCRERVVITTDRITLDGEGSAVLDGGGGQLTSAAVQDPEFDALIIVDGVTGVTIVGFSIQNGSGNGILGTHSAAFAVSKTTVQHNAITGLVVSDNSTVELSDSTLQHNLLGMDVFTSSSAILRGIVAATKNTVDGIEVNGQSILEIRGAQVQLNNNGVNGLVAGPGCAVAIFGFTASKGSTLTANENGDSGILVGGSSLTVFGEASTINAANNTVNGIWLPADGAVLSPFGRGTFVIENNAVGLNIGQQSGAVIVGGLNVKNNKVTGLLADGAGSLTLVSIPPNPSSITGNGTDVDLRFGTRTTIDGVTIGTTVCDKTVLSRGTTVCP
jgi:hypothetical protein